MASERKTEAEAVAAAAVTAAGSAEEEGLEFVRTCTKDLAFTPGKAQATTIETSLWSAVKNMGRKKAAILACSWEGDATAIAARSGFIEAVVHAYNTHSRLVLTPDLVWNTILAQLGLYMDANAEKLRAKVVDHSGKETITVTGGGSTLTKETAAAFAELFLEAILARMNSDAKWLVPDFSTTTATDRVCGAISLMAAAKSYFTYIAMFACGIPYVALRGTEDDWVRLAEKVTKLRHFETDDAAFSAFVTKLEFIAANLLATKRGKPDMEFWDRAVTRVRLGSGGQTGIGGWVSAFMAFGNTGKPRTGGHTPMPSNVAIAPVTVVYLDGTTQETSFSAGCFGVNCSGQDVQPACSWVVTEELTSAREDGSSSSSEDDE